MTGTSRTAQNDGQPPAFDPANADASARAAPFVRTCWRRLELEHPADWEITAASPAGEPPQCTMSDRRNERLKIRWREISYTPKLEKVVERQRNKDETVVPLDGRPPGWHGVVVRTATGCITHAGRFFGDRRMLAEAILLWPGKRNARIERRLLESICPHPAEETCLWQAMGLKARVPAALELAEYKADAGQITWIFGAGRAGPCLTLERFSSLAVNLGAPHDKRGDALAKWLESRLEKCRVVRTKRNERQNGHDAVIIESLRRARGPTGLLGRKTGVLDIAWLCPVEERVYRVSHVRSGRDTGPTWPNGLTVECCRNDWKLNLFAGQD